MLEMKRNLLNSIAVGLYSILILVPLWLALDRLIWVAGYDVLGWFESLNENFISNGVLEFTILQATLSMVFTLAIGIPIAWQLGRYKWPFESLIRSLLTMPFVMPSIIAAMGFMHIIGQDGLDIRSNPNTWFATLIIAHAWFNIALVIRFCEPVLSTLDPNLEEQMRLLPAGKTRWDRIRNLWGPILIPSIAAAACMTFVFSFTSFALVRWITLGENTLESMMAELGSSAGISGYMVAKNEVILGASIIQFAILLFALWLMSTLQHKRQNTLPQSSKEIVKSENKKGWFVIVPAILFAILPLLTLVISSFRIRKNESGVSKEYWSLEGWEYAFAATNSLPSAWDALANSVGYAIVTLLIALPLGWILAQTIYDIENRIQNLVNCLMYSQCYHLQSQA